MDHVVTADGRLRVWETFRRVKPPELYSFWTDPDKLTRWWPSEASVDAEPGGGYRYTLEDGEVLSGLLSDVEPGRRLAFSLQRDGLEQRVVVDLEPKGADTLLTVTHGPFGGKTEREAQLETWTRLLKRLKTATRDAA